MTENREPDPKPPAPDPEPPAPDPEPPGPDPKPRELDPGPPGPDAKPPQDDIRWLIYLAIGLVLFLALVAWSGFHNAMGH